MLVLQQPRAESKHFLLSSREHHNPTQPAAVRHQSRRKQPLQPRRAEPRRSWADEHFPPLGPLPAFGPPPPTLPPACSLALAAAGLVLLRLLKLRRTLSKNNNFCGRGGEANYCARVLRAFNSSPCLASEKETGAEGCAAARPPHLSPWVSARAPRKSRSSRFSTMTKMRVHYARATKQVAARVARQ